MYFTDQEKAAIVKLAKLMIAIDGKFEKNEGIVMANEMIRMGITDPKPILAASDAMEFGAACSVVSKMSSTEKKYVCSVLGTIIAADYDIDETETKMWTLMSVLCDFPEMTIAQAVEYLAKL